MQNYSIFINNTDRNDIDCEEEESTFLTLSTCKDNEFACSNGLCIDITKRCDSQTDCKDKSDEFGCRRINPDRSYQKFIAPPKYKGQISSKIVIEVSADIMDILDIDEKASIFQVIYKLRFLKKMLKHKLCFSGSILPPFLLV